MILLMKKEEKVVRKMEVRLMKRKKVSLVKMELEFKDNLNNK